MTIQSKEYIDNKNLLIITLYNINNLSWGYLYKGIFYTLFNDKDFNSFSNYKIIISKAISISDESFMLHSNYLVTNKTTINNLFNFIIPNLYSFKYNMDSEHYFLNSSVSKVEIKIWNVEKDINKHIKNPFKDSINNTYIYNKSKSNANFNKRSFHTSSYKLHDFTILKSKNKLIKKNISAMDIETMQYKDNKFEYRIQIPTLLTFAYYDSLNQIKYFKTLINLDLLKSKGADLAIKDLLERFFTEMLKAKIKNHVIFMHNLGKFDGFHLITHFVKNTELVTNLSTISDKNNAYIQIQCKIYGMKLIWKDSLRIFPISLDKFCRNMNVDGKLSKYRRIYNTFKLFRFKFITEQWINYGIQDSIALLQALKKAQNIYIENYNVDITSIWSTSTLALKIFRQDFLNVTIPSLSSSSDFYIRKAYYGGATDHYIQRGVNIYIYDINSLYPDTMLKNPIPLNPLQYYKDMRNIDFNNFFGFCVAKIETPTNLKIPILPYRKDTGELCFPLGIWTGVYFSEELKKVAKYGYKITPIEGWEFSKLILFDKYVIHFYDIKKNAKSDAEKFIAKMQLNQLYGYFGRSRELIITKYVNKNELENLVKSSIIRKLIEVNDDLFIVSITANINYKIINELNMKLDNKIKEFNYNSIKSNVAVAAAVTAYARMKMIDFKMSSDFNILYTDTDSIYTDKPIPKHLIGNEIGLFKNELEGKAINNIIKEAIFIGNKQYIYKYIDLKGKDITVSKFSGIERNKLTWNQFELVAQGIELNIKEKNKFIRSYQNLTMRIKSTYKKISNSNSKTLVNNLYIPPVIFDTNNPFTINPKLLINIINRFKFYFKKYLNIF